ncbi:MAG TPA: VacJ family lipoprotein [Rubrivivax sp.]|nr:VacJ family lipoprotein [Rubrivivax sp.]
MSRRLLCAARRGLWGLALAALVALCAAAPLPAAAAAEDDMDYLDEPHSAPLAPDPWEPFNRAMFKFNQDLDDGMLYPWADAYVTLVPALARTGVHNFFNNFQDLWSAVNNLLQGKLEQSVAMSFRFVWNTVFGWGGLIDMATEFGIERTPEDFGQTLGVWGVPTGNFLMLPLFGPSTVRDAVALPLDIAATPAYAINQGSFRPVTAVVEIVDARAQLLGAGKLLDTIALDKYIFVRDAFLVRRLNLVYDGNPPEPPPPAKKTPTD